MAKNQKQHPQLNLAEQKSPINKKIKAPVNVRPLKKGDESTLVLDFNEFSEIVTHLFILKTAKMNKYHGWMMDWQKDIQQNPGRMEAMDHQHSFRTMTSQGEFQTQANTVGGHFHVCKIKVHEDGPKKGKVLLDKDNHLQIEVGPAMTIINDKLAPYPYDQHTHESFYRNSNRIKVVAISDEVLQHIGTLKATYGLVG